MRIAASTPEALQLLHNIASTAVTWSSGRLDVFGLGSNNALYHKWYQRQWGPSQNDWEYLGGTFSSQPEAVSWGPNRIDIFGLGTNNQMYHKYWNG
ncbi:hypothetical protein LOZ41_003929, partial [Ophidiomyces ophidiicola]